MSAPKDRRMSDKNTLLYLVRHGATSANEQRPYILQGSSVDLPLSPTGRSQAEAVGRQLAEIPLQAIYASTMVRAVETAGEVARHHDLSPQTDSRLIEVDVGLWESLDWGTIERDFPDDYAAFRRDSGNTPYLGGESYAQVLNRVRPVFDELIEKHRGESFAVVAHNVVNRAYLSHLLGQSISEAKDIEQTNCCVNIIEDSPAKQRRRVKTLNADFHITAN
ncbi:histidine phosphatase family protein [Stratiformator vulcanicus]|uniref:Phosphoserine phosphatase 1 n=1 Tax=Stratiformator vulcanicus TaxID=2527980 RepID=A0A517QZH2_9PLAN|nr:histidine phosphatase family protein [Stratiformator vulcanicus]QDT37046.1 Phosphoserine phosphatase 1 [Stratiformator vulcanicus]